MWASLEYYLKERKGSPARADKPEERNCAMKQAGKKMAALVLAATIACMMLVACSGQQTGSSSSASSSAAASSSAEQSASSTAAGVDISGWKTLGDALAAATGKPGSGGDEKTYVAVFEVGDSFVRVVAKMEPGLYDKIRALDYGSDDYDKKFAELAGGLAIESAEDITSGKLSQDALDAYVGKTGQDLMDDGFEFSSYYMFAGDETGASMDKGFFSYGVTFDAKVPEDKAEDQGASIKDATVKAIQFVGVADSVFDTGSAGVDTTSLKDDPEEAKYQIEVAMQYQLEQAYGDKINDARIYVEKVYTTEQEQADELLKSYNLGPDEVAFEVKYELHPADGVDVNSLTAATGQYDEKTGWVIDKYNVGILRPNPDGEPAYIVTDFGTGF